LSTLLNAGYFLPIVYRAFFVAPASDGAAHGEAPATMLAAMAASAGLTVALFFFADLPVLLALRLTGGA
jgi:multicomponent Na+:H+ antiporter subunit D